MTSETRYQLMGERKFDLVEVSWGGLTFPNPETSASSSLADQKSTNNVTGVKEPRIDAMLDPYDKEFDPQKRKRYAYRVDGRCAEGLTGVTTLDDNVTQACIRVLMRVDRALQFKDQPIHEAAQFALDKLIEVQYPIGAWPQRYERQADFSKFPVTSARNEVLLGSTLRK